MQGFLQTHSLITTPVTIHSVTGLDASVLYVSFMKTPQELAKSQYTHHPIIPNSSFLQQIFSNASLTTIK